MQSQHHSVIDLFLMKHHHCFDLIVEDDIGICELVAAYEFGLLQSLVKDGQDLSEEFVETPLYLVLRKGLLVEGFRTNNHFYQLSAAWLHYTIEPSHHAIHYWSIVIRIEVQRHLRLFYFVFY